MAAQTHVITGDRVQVAAVVDRARADGRLIAVTEATLLPGDRVQLVAAIRSESRWQRLRPWLIGLGKALVVLAVVAAVAGLLWVTGSALVALITVVVAAVAWVHAHLVAIGIGIAALVIGLVVASSGGHRCVGVHCRGCRR
jgi:hypothetical protein